MGAKPRAFKHWLDPARIRQISAAIAEASPEFDADGFATAAQRGLAALELKARVRHVIDCLHASLPQPFDRAVAALLAAVRLDGQKRTGDDRWLRGFAAWPLIDYVGEHGVDHREVSLSALRELTCLFSAEFAIRPFLERYPDETLRELETWTKDASEHVRRLVSEGTRPLLPWGMRLGKFRDDPEPVIALLEQLKSDPAEYVRRSVANNLNDIAKDHPERVVEICRRWLDDGDGDVNRQRLVKHGLRTLIKRGNADALALLGFGSDLAAKVSDVELSPRALAEGGAVELQFELSSTSTATQNVIIDYAVHFVKANGKRSPKVFKLKALRLGPGETVTVRKKHSMKTVTTRVHYPGTHAIELLINGKPSGRAEFELVE